MATKITIPMALLTVEVNSGNAFWTARSGAQIDDGYIQFVDAGVGEATYWMITPRNIASTEAWTLDMHHHANAGLGSGNVSVKIFAQVASDTSLIDGNTSLLVAGSAYASDTAFTITRLSGGTFDSVVGLSANTYLRVIVVRSGNDGNDTLSAGWNLNSLNWIGDIE